MKLRPDFARARRRIDTLRSLSEAAQRRLGLDSHLAVARFAARLAVSRVRSAAAQRRSVVATDPDPVLNVRLKHYGAAVEPRHATFLDIPGDRAELARAQLFRLALADGLPTDTLLGLVVHDLALQSQVAAEAADWAAVVGRPLRVAYVDRADALSAVACAKLRERMKLASLAVIDATWLYESFEPLLRAIESGDAKSANAVGHVGGFRSTESGVETLIVPADGMRCAAQLPPWSAAANRFAGLLPWIVRGTRLLDRAGHALGALGLGASRSEAVVDLCLHLPDGSLFLGGGWTCLRDPMTGIHLVDKRSGAETDLQEFWSALPRPELRMALRGLVEDAASDGFVAHLPAATQAGTGASPATVLRMRFASGRVQDLKLKPQTATDRLEAADQLLRRLPQAHPDLRELLDRRLGPAVSALGPASPVRADQLVIREYGRVPDAPGISARISIVVPLYGRHDFLRHQLAHFCGDAQFRQVDLIYVIDDPRLVAMVDAEADDLARLFGASFRTVHAGRNLGYAGANNLGARLARAPTLLLLNSDVIPLRPGWCEAMCSALESSGVGAVGAKLLFEDGSVQHAGMISAPYGPWDGLPINLHPGKALPDVVRGGCEPVHALTGACLMLRTGLYREMGGLDEGFLVGDFEDSELCSRLRRHGLSILLCHDSVLVHLERQSMPSGEVAAMQARRSLYNAWRAAQRELALEAAEAAT